MEIKKTKSNKYKLTHNKLIIGSDIFKLIQIH